MLTRYNFWRSALIVAGAVAVGAATIAPAQAQFGRVYMRYSMYGSGPYGYGSTGYYKAITPRSPSYENLRLTQPDYGYEPAAIYLGTLPTYEKPEPPQETWRHVPWYDSRVGPDYHYFGGGIYGPYGPADYGVHPPKDIYRAPGNPR